MTDVAMDEAQPSGERGFSPVAAALHTHGLILEHMNGLCDLVLQSAKALQKEHARNSALALQRVAAPDAAEEPAVPVPTHLPKPPFVWGPPAACVQHSYHLMRAGSRRHTQPLTYEQIATIVQHLWTCSRRPHAARVDAEFVCAVADWLQPRLTGAYEGEAEAFARASELTYHILRMCSYSAMPLPSLEEVCWIRIAGAEAPPGDAAQSEHGI